MDSDGKLQEAIAQMRRTAVRQHYAAHHPIAIKMYPLKDGIHEDDVVGAMADAGYCVQRVGEEIDTTFRTMYGMLTGESSIVSRGEEVTGIVHYRGNHVKVESNEQARIRQALGACLA